MNTDKTYTETKNYVPFNWHEALSNPDITRKDWADMNCRASDWVTCAVGEPLDQELNWLGISFMMAIRNKDVGDSKRILKDIELRSSILIEYYSQNQ